MKLIIINQDPIEITDEQARSIVDAVTGGAEVVIVNGEMVRTSAIMGVRNSGETLPASQWGALPAGTMRSFYDDRREPKSDGYKKYQAMRRKLFNT